MNTENVNPQHNIEIYVSPSFLESSSKSSKMSGRKISKDPSTSPEAKKTTLILQVEQISRDKAVEELTQGSGGIHKRGWVLHNSSQPGMNILSIVPLIEGQNPVVHIHVPKDMNPAAIQGEINAWRPLSPDVKSKIENDVSQYLSPYISGKITAENEPLDKKPLMTALLEKFGSAGAGEQIQEVALPAFVKTAIWGAIQMIGSKKKSKLGKGIKDLEEINFGELSRAIKESIAKDFPDLMLTDKSINLLIKETFININSAYYESKMDDRKLTRAEKKSNNIRIQAMQRQKKAPIWKSDKKILKEIERSRVPSMSNYQEVDKNEAEEMLADASEYTHLFRKTDKGFAMSIKTINGVEHFRLPRKMKETEIKTFIQKLKKRDTSVP